MKYRTTLVACASLCGLVLAGYHRAPDNGFHFDDGPSIYRNQAISQSTASLDGLWRAIAETRIEPRYVATATFVMDWWRGGGSARPFQWTNILLHAVTALFVFALVSLLIERTRAGPGEAGIIGIAAAVAVAAWALHPIQVQAVTYVVQRMAVLAALGVCSGIYFYLRARLSQGRRWPWLLAMAVSLTLGGFSKENAWIAPVLLLLAEYAVVRRDHELFERRTDRVLFALPVVVFLTVVLGMALGVPPVDRFVEGYEYRDFAMAERLLTQPRVILFHAAQLLFPLPGGFSIEHDLTWSRSLFDPWTTLPAAIAVAGWFAGFAWLFVRKATRLLGFFGLWVPVTLVIESSFVPLEMVFEHRMYLPTVGLAGLLALAALRLVRWARSHSSVTPSLALVAGSALVVASLTAATIQLTTVWRNDVTLYSHAVRVSPNSPRAAMMLGQAYWRTRNREEAIRWYERSVQIDPTYWAGLMNLANAYRWTGQSEGAFRYYQLVVTTYPLFTAARFSLASMLVERGAYAEAREHLYLLLQQEPGNQAASGLLRQLDLRLARPSREDDER